MQATSWEFRRRFFVIGAIFGLGFFAYAVDHVNVSVFLGGWLARYDGYSTDANARAIIGKGAAIAFMAFLLRIWGTAYLRAEVMSDTRIRTEQLVADGPYRFVRNPLYLGTWLMATGMATLASRLGAMVIVVGIIIFFLRLIGREEAELKTAQGDGYRRFLQTVPRILPSLWPRVPSAGRKPQWGQALLGEAYILGFALAIASVAYRGDMSWFRWILAASFVPFAITRIRLIRRAHREVPNP
jgi:protein-S-isoprenylcysteine O-methyltransferase Ste14